MFVRGLSPGYSCQNPGWVFVVQSLIPVLQEMMFCPVKA